MIDRLSGIVLLPTDGNPAGSPVDLLIGDGRIAAITPAAAPPARRLLATPALVNAHDHARPLSPTSFGAGGKPLETWLLRLAAMPAIDPYLGALATFGRAARAGAGSVMAHGPMSPVEEAREVARAAAAVGVRVTFAVFMRDRNPLVYGDEENVIETMPADVRATVEAQFLGLSLSPAEQVARVEAIAEATESATFSVQFGPSGPQWCSDTLLAAIADASRRTGRRVHMHLLETRYQRAFADRAYRDGVAQRLKALGLLSPRLTLAHCVHARPEELDLIAASGAIIATNPSSNLHLKSGIAPISDALKRGCRVALGVDSSALDEDDDIVREMRLGHFLHGGWGFDSVIERGAWLAAIVANGRFANGAPARGLLRSANLPTFLCSISTRSTATRSWPSSRSTLCSRGRTPPTSLVLSSLARKSCATGGSLASTSRARKRSCAVNNARMRHRGRRFWPPGTRSSLQPRNTIKAASAAADGSRRAADHAG